MASFLFNIFLFLVLSDQVIVCVFSISDQTLRQVAGLLGVEYESLMRISDERRESQPAIYGLTVAQEENEVYVQSEDRGRGHHSVRAGSCSVFNIDFPRKVKNLLYFLQKYVIGIDDGTKTPGKVLTFLSKQ